MQEGIHRALRWRPVLLKCRFGLAQQGVIFGVLADDGGSCDFSTHQGLLGFKFLPGGAEELTDLIPGWIKHESTSCRVK